MQPRLNRRAHVRVHPAGPIVARLIAGHEGRVHDLGAGGLRLEHEGILRPGKPCLVRLRLHDEPFTFGGRVVWSRAIGPAGPGSGRLLFWTGIAFERVPAAAQPVLAQLVGAPPHPGG